MFETLDLEKGILAAEKQAGRCSPIAGFEGLDSIESFKNQPILRDLVRPDTGRGPFCEKSPAGRASVRDYGSCYS